MKTSADTYSSDVIRFTLVVLSAVFLISCVTAKPERASKTGYAVASWYGPKFHGKLTASGEKYDMDALTCAHKRLPFGTRLEIINVENDKSVMVVVNDRGPFVRGRDIDLSREAARQLGIIGPGTGRVKYRIIGRDMRYSKYMSSGTGHLYWKGVSEGKGPFTIQVGAFKEKSNAVYLKKGLDLNYKKVYMMEKWINGERFYRVRIGKFSSAKKAEQVARQLSEEGYTTSIARYERI